MGYKTAAQVVLAMKRAYFDERDVDGVLAGVTEDIVWIGMSKGDEAYGKAELRALLERDKQEYPQSFSVTLGEQRVITHTDHWTTVIICGVQHFVAEESMDFHIRCSVDCVLTEDGWLASCAHTSVHNMTYEKYRLNHALTEEQIKQEVLLRSISGGAAIYRLKKDRRIPTDYVSENMAVMFGYESAKEMLDYIRDDCMHNVFPEDIPIVRNAVERALVEGTGISAVYRSYNKEQKPFWMRLEANFIPEAELQPDELAVIYAVHLPLSDFAEQAMMERTRYRKILDSLGVAYFELNEGEDFYASEKFSQYMISTIPFETVRANTAALDIVHPDDVPQLFSLFQKKEAHCPQADAILRCKMVDGTYRWTEIVGLYEFDEGGQAIRQIGVFRDAEDEWVKQNMRLQEALAAAKKASETQTEFFARLSHDIRTPLNGILGFTRIAGETDDVEQARNYLAKIQSSGEYLLALMNDVLDMSKIESDAFELHEEPMNGARFLASIADMFQEVAAQKGVTLVTDFTRAEIGWIMLDQLRTRQVLNNILSNAIKFSAPGTTISWCIVNTPVEAGEVETVCTIRDQGCGMSEEFLERLFEPFSQEKNTYSGLQSGTGLGLSIVKKLIDAMGGTIKIDSTQGVGTTVTTRLRYKTTEPPEERSAAVVADQGVNLDGKRILLCEDNLLNQEIALELLRRKGMEITVAENGLLGVETFLASPDGAFDAILMDIQMPELNGLEAAKRIRALPRTDAATIPIIAMTADAYAEDVQKAMSAGMNYHLAKPIDPEKLYTILAQHIAAYRQ